MIRLPGRLYPDSPPEHFPGIEMALKEPNGLLAAGGDLSTERLLYAYRRGIFPWFSESQPILWWSPDPRTVLFPHALKISRSLAKVVRQGRYRITANMAFPAVVEACAAPRKGQPGTWITPAMMSAYGRLHAIGVARSLECWSGDALVGGLYGVSIGKVFFGESMFSRAPDASKVALTELCRMDYRLIDCQMPNAHLFSLGAVCVPRTRFAELVERWCEGEDAVFGARSARVPG